FERWRRDVLPGARQQHHRGSRLPVDGPHDWAELGPNSKRRGPVHRQYDAVAGRPEHALVSRPNSSRPANARKISRGRAGRDRPHGKHPLHFRKTLQQLSVPFEYPVYFTEGALSPVNEAFVEALSYKEPRRRHRLAVIIDAGVALARPDLTQD